MTKQRKWDVNVLTEKTKKQRRWKTGDLILFGVILLFFASSAIYFYYQNQQPIPLSYARVQHLETGEETLYPLYEGQDEVLEFQGPEGITRVYLRDGGAEVTYSDCPDQVCVQVFGWINRPGQVSVCLPNRIMVQIEAVPEEDDDI